MDNKPYGQMTHDEILREHANRYAKMTPKQRLEQKDAYLPAPSEKSGHDLKTRTLVTAGAIAVVFGYWQNSTAAGLFAFLTIFLITMLFFRTFKYIHAVKTEVAGFAETASRIETLLSERLEDPTGGCTGYRDCPCWWHTEQRRLAEDKKT